MRYRMRDPFQWETGGQGDPAAEPPTGDVAGDADGAMDPGAEPEPAGDQADAGEPSADAAEPPLWQTADDQVLHLPPEAVERVGTPGTPGSGPPPSSKPPGPPRPPLPPRPPRPLWPRPRPRPAGVLPVRPDRQGIIHTVGQLVRRARLMSTRWPRRRGPGLPVFRSRFRGRNFRIVARPRGGLRHEILSIEPEGVAAERMLEELEAVPASAFPEPAKTPAPFAPPPPPGSYWPVQTSHSQARVVSYLTAAGKSIGNSSRRFLAGRKGKRNGVPTARNHAGIDLYASRGDPVIACEDGTVLSFRRFYKAKSGQQTHRILVQHSRLVINYGEVTPDSFRRTGLKEGSAVRAGQVIGYVSDTDMLHFETYTLGTTETFQWWTGSPPPPRLLNPTGYLLHLVLEGRSATGAGKPGAPAGGSGSWLTRLPEAIGGALRKGPEYAGLALAINRGERDSSRLTSQVFYARHPERKGQPLRKGEKDFDRLATEWLAIRSQIVAPMLARVGSAPAGTAVPATPKGQPSPAASGAGAVPQGRLGQLVVEAPGWPPLRYQFTPEDAVWTARMVKGEAGEEENLKTVAVIWALVNRFGLFHKRLGYKTFWAFLREYSTPLQPHLKNPGAIERAMDTSRRHPGNPDLRWVQWGTFEYKGKRYPKGHYPMGQYQKHLTLQKTPWNQLPIGARRVTERVLGGQVASPIGLASDFAGTDVLLDRHLEKAGRKPKQIRRDAPEEYRRLWTEFTKRHANNMTPPRIWIGESVPGLNQMSSNAFYLDSRASRLPKGAVRIVPA